MLRLRGVGYSTHDWAGGALLSRHEVSGANTGPAHKKFANYEFDPAEFVKLVARVREKVLNNPLYIKSREMSRDEL